MNYIIICIIHNIIILLSYSYIPAKKKKKRVIIEPQIDARMNLLQDQKMINVRVSEEEVAEMLQSMGWNIKIINRKEKYW